MNTSLIEMIESLRDALQVVIDSSAKGKFLMEQKVADEASALLERHRKKR